jgi:hypothetical protein
MVICCMTKKCPHLIAYHKTILTQVYDNGPLVLQALWILAPATWAPHNLCLWQSTVQKSCGLVHPLIHVLPPLSQPLYIQLRSLAILRLHTKGRWLVSFSFLGPIAFHFLVINTSKSGRESLLMTNRPVRIQTKFWQHNSVILQLHTRNDAAENIRIMPPNFRPDLNQTSRHKHALSDTPRLSKKGQLWNYTPHMHSACETCRFKMGDVYGSATYNLTVEIS